ncbi:hypothetical protein [uncultured Clostridium sp.]|uniref:hypothetical protein n=1 Tax=uncultured Clostridium sp. TaxID=59620 RepID=UPI0026F34301|nr:hypothetical protein [uncultured Clostridium sp.]
MENKDLGILVEKLNSAIDKFQQGFDAELLDLIVGTESDIYSGTDEDGCTIIVGIEQGVGLKKSTYQSNGWIRVNDYTIQRNEDDMSMYILQSETYTK